MPFTQHSHAMILGFLRKMGWRSSLRGGRFCLPPVFGVCIPQHSWGDPGTGARASSDPCRSNRSSVPGSRSQACAASSERGARLQRGGHCGARMTTKLPMQRTPLGGVFRRLLAGLPSRRLLGHRHLPGWPANIRPRLQTHEDIRSWEPYLVYAFGVFQPSIVHFFHIVGTSPAEEGLSSNGGGKAPNLPQRPGCCWSVL